MPDFSSIYQHLGVVSIALTWAGIIYLVKKWPGDKSMTLSQHAAQTKQSQIFYATLFSLALPLLYVFVYFWLMPNLKLPSIFNYLVIFAILGQLLAVYVPEVEGVKKKIHYGAAYVMHTLLIPITFLLFFSQASITLKIVALIALGYMIVAWLMSHYSSLVRKHSLYVQVIYALLFHVAILTATYSGQGL